MGWLGVTAGMSGITKGLEDQQDHTLDKSRHWQCRVADLLLVPPTHISCITMDLKICRKILLPATGHRQIGGALGRFWQLCKMVTPRSEKRRVVSTNGRTTLPLEMKSSWATPSQRCNALLGAADVIDMGSAPTLLLNKAHSLLPVLEPPPRQSFLTAVSGYRPALIGLWSDDV
jgi:hypothetical protein